MRVYGALPTTTAEELHALVQATHRLEVQRNGAARSATPFPKSVDLELALLPLLAGRGFHHHVRLEHPRTGQGFEYDFWRPQDGMAIEIMGYRADDEVYKDLLKFHVHPGTRVGVVMVPRWKWISGQRHDRNYTETVKALAFADTFMDVDALVVLPYDWAETSEGTWQLIHVTAP
jgi:hypothetical protein